MDDHGLGSGAPLVSSTDPGGITAGSASELHPPHVRSTVAVVVTRFPRLEDTSILRELEELERQGQPVLVVPVTHSIDQVVHEEAQPWVSRALYTPFASREIVRSNLTSLGRQPVRYLALLLRLVIGTIVHPPTFLRSLALFPKAVYLATVLRQRGIQHIHAHGATYATTMAWVISSLIDATYSFTTYGPDVFVHRALLERKIRDAKFVRTVSVFNKAFLTGLYPATAEDKIFVVPPGVDPGLYDAAREIAASSKRRSQILSVSAASPGRGLHFLIEACAQLVREGIELDCRIVAADNALDDIRSLIIERELAGVVHLLGPQSQREIARLMGEADVYVLPSIIAPNGQMDGIPLSLIEAMAAGKPVVASALSGIPEIVKHDENGLLVDSTHPERIAAAIHRLLGDSNLRDRLGLNSRRTVAGKFDVRRTSAALVELFDRHEKVNGVSSTTKQRIQRLQWWRLQVCALGVRKIHERSDASIAEVTITDGITRRDVVVRRHRPSPDGSTSALARARAEFEALSVLKHGLDRNGSDATAGGTIYAVPDVLMLDEENAALVVTRADGKTLAGIMRETRRNRSSAGLTTALRQAGRWLHSIQQDGDESDGAAILEARTAAALVDLELAAAAESPLRREFGRLADRLKVLEVSASASPMPVVGHHGSFSAENIFIGPRRVEVTDFGRYRKGFPLEDVARLLIDLELFFSAPWFRRQLPRFRDAFLKGWSPAEEVDQAALQLFVLTEALHVLANSGDERGWSHRKRRVLMRVVERGLDL
jgi:colanic acid/amylovoran biosynthesis glycosyltransferase